MRRSGGASMKFKHLTSLPAWVRAPRPAITRASHHQAYLQAAAAEATGVAMHSACLLQHRAVVVCQAAGPQDRAHVVAMPAPTLARSQLLRAAVATTGLSAAAALVPSSALAAESVLAPLDSLLDMLSMVPPEPVTFPRRRLDLNFAVLLMRSGYEAVDDLDFVAMSEFERQFWKLRANEYQGYTVQYLPVRIKQGDLSSPEYFDFISFAQYATVNQEIPRGTQVFEEYCEECEGQKRLVTRDPARQDNRLLPGLHAQLTGDHIYDGLLNGFRGVQYGGPQPCKGCSFEQLLEGVQQIHGVFQNQGFAVNIALSNAAPAVAGGGGSFRVRLEGPANLWALQTLASRRSSVYNAYDALAVQAYLRASGRDARYKLSWTDTAVTEEWVVA